MIKLTLFKKNSYLSRHRESEREGERRGETGGIPLSREGKGRKKERKCI